MTAPSNVYTCGYWAAGAANITEAQRAKMTLVCEKARLPRHNAHGNDASRRKPVRVLDIGCGYGALGKFMTEHYDVQYVGVTISAEQQKFAAANMCNNRK